MKTMPHYPGMDVGAMTKRQQRRAQRRRDKEARRRARQQAEHEKARRGIAHALRCGGTGSDSRPRRPMNPATLMAVVATAIAATETEKRT